jgi:hypothetical protein
MWEDVENKVSVEGKNIDTDRCTRETAVGGERRMVKACSQ